MVIRCFLKIAIKAEKHVKRSRTKAGKIKMLIITIILRGAAADTITIIQRAKLLMRKK